MCPLADRRRPLLLGAALALALTGLAVQVMRSPSRLLGLPLFDYAAFWSAARLNQSGHDPYDVDRLRALQHQAEPNVGGVLVMWPAPWALTLLRPLAGLDPHVGHLAWMLLQFLVLIVAVEGAWRMFGGEPERRWVAYLVAFTFLPTYFVLVTGQLGPLLLVGFVGFLYCLGRGWDGRAGAFLVLAAIKPQLSYLFWIALLLWAWDGRRWRLVAGGVLGAAAALAWPLFDNPALPAQYWHALTHRTHTHGHQSPLLGTALNLAFGNGHFGLQFVPMLPGLLWLAWYWRRHRGAWDWQRQLPPLLFASFLTAPYGAWPFDLVVLLPALLQTAAGLEHAPRRAVALAVGCHLAVNLLALAQILGSVEYFWFLWMTPALLLGWLLLRPPARPAATAALANP